MKKVIAAVLIAVAMLTLAGCRQSEIASWNVSQEADNFNIGETLRGVGEEVAKALAGMKDGK